MIPGSPAARRMRDCKRKVEGSFGQFRVVGGCVSMRETHSEESTKLARPAVFARFSRRKPFRLTE